MEDGRRVEGDWSSFSVGQRGRGRDKPPPRIVHGYAGTVYAAQGRTVSAAVLHLASGTDAREVYVGLTRHTEDAWVVAETERLEAICRRRQADHRIRPAPSDIRERLFREARQYGDKRNVVDYVADRSEFARTGQIRTAEDETRPSLAARTIEAARSLRRALAWLQDIAPPAPAWLYLNRARERIREWPAALREIVARADRTVSRERGHDRSGPDLGR
jgi:hypothetical protein